MAPNVDEDLIEATIRRVAEAKAAAEAGGGADVEATAESADAAAASDAHAVEGKQQAANSKDSSDDDTDEDAIAATIARVAAAKAAREQQGDQVEEAIAAAERSDDSVADAGKVLASDDEGGGADEDAIAATIARVAAAKAAREASTGEAQTTDSPEQSGKNKEQTPTHAPAQSQAAAVDDDAIAATIARVAAAKAAREGNAGQETAGDRQQEAEAAAAEQTATSKQQDADREPAVSTAAADEDAIAATIARVADASADRDRASKQGGQRTRQTTGAPEAETAAGEQVSTAPAGGQESAARSDELGDVTARIDREIATINRAIAVLTQRIDGLVSEIQRVSSAASAAVRERVAPADDEEDWDAPPVISRLPSSMPPRPAIFRDLPSQPAAQALASALPAESVDEIDEEEPPEPLGVAAPVPEFTSARGPDSKLNIELLPRTYRITVEDKRRSVDLVPLHRSLRAMDGVRDMSLLSYNNGIAIVSLESVREIDPKDLEESVSHAMSRGARVEVHNEHTMVVKLAEE